jgi:dimethylhistidine N-methyltransferase
MTLSGLDDHDRKAFAEDVRRGLSASPKTLPSKYFYDALGSLLFEAICQLPWYPITRAETRLLERNAAEMVAPLGAVSEIVELGCGSGEKIARIARAVSTRGAPYDLHLVDVSQKALDLAKGALQRIPGARIVTHRASYEEGLAAVAAHHPRRGARLACFFGSNIGNFDPPAASALLRALRGALVRGDGLLLGVDLVRAEDDLVRAYDDPLGVTAAFNKNVLLRINTELGGDFDLDGFAHKAVWNAAASRMEMHLVSTRAQGVRVPGAGVEAMFAEGESIWTESSYKHTLAGLGRMAEGAGFTLARTWVDEEGGFASGLLVVA